MAKSAAVRTYIQRLLLILRSQDENLPRNVTKPQLDARGESLRQQLEDIGHQGRGDIPEDLADNLVERLQNVGSAILFNQVLQLPTRQLTADDVKSGKDRIDQAIDAAKKARDEVLKWARDEDAKPRPPGPPPAKPPAIPTPTPAPVELTEVQKAVSEVNNRKLAQTIVQDAVAELIRPTRSVTLNQKRIDEAKAALTQGAVSTFFRGKKLAPLPAYPEEPGSKSEYAAARFVSLLQGDLTGRTHTIDDIQAIFSDPSLQLSAVNYANQASNAATGQLRILSDADLVRQQSVSKAAQSDFLDRLERIRSDAATDAAIFDLQWRAYLADAYTPQALGA
jgi:hypothetical protein